MSPTFVALALLAGFLGFRLYARFAPARPRPIFAENHIFAGRLTEGLLHALISDRGFMRVDTRLSAFEGSAVIVDRDGACGRLVLYPALGFGRESDLVGLRAVAAAHADEQKTTVVVVGGGEEFAHTALDAAAPLRALHIGDDGRLREIRRGFKSAAPRLVVESALDRMAWDLKDGAFPTVDLLTARSLVGPSDEGLSPPTRAAFRGVVTTALTVAIAVCFAIEVAISRDSIRGDGAVLSVVYRMGAIYQPAILGGEWQRLIAAPFLHFGLLHLGMNGWAQWSLGAPLEFLVGPWRFLGLWVGSALGASLTSVIFHETSVSAGASGAIFGLLGAFTTFVFFRKDVLPQPVPRPLRNGVLATLVLNLFISFIPGIDMAAHAGGFVTGALMALGIVRRGRSEPVRPGPLRLAVAAMILLGVGATSIQERAHRATSIPELGDERRVGELRLPVPRGFQVSESRQSGLTLFEADGGPGSPYSITYKVSDVQPDEEAALRLLSTMRSPEAPQGPSGWVALSRLGVQGYRAIEIVVVAPESCRVGAEALGAKLAKNTR